ncbi:hypothetical protein CBL_09423 [Carabus blaptoides fortunei]
MSSLFCKNLREKQVVLPVQERCNGRAVSGPASNQAIFVAVIMNIGGVTKKGEVNRTFCGLSDTQEKTQNKLLKFYDVVSSLEKQSTKNGFSHCESYATNERFVMEVL